MTPKRDSIKTVDAGKAERQGRLNKAQQFLQSADDLRGFYEDDSVVADTAVTLYVHAGIASRRPSPGNAIGRDQRDLLDGNPTRRRPNRHETGATGLSLLPTCAQQKLNR